MAQGKCEMFPEDESHALSATQVRASVPAVQGMPLPAARLLFSRCT